MSRVNVLDFHGNGSIVEVEGLKPQAGEAPSTKLQASSTRSVRQIVAGHYVTLTQNLVVRRYVLLTQAPSTTNHGSV